MKNLLKTFLLFTKKFEYIFLITYLYLSMVKSLEYETEIENEFVIFSPKLTGKQNITIFFYEPLLNLNKKCAKNKISKFKI